MLIYNNKDRGKNVFIFSIRQVGNIKAVSDGAFCVENIIIVEKRTLSLMKYIEIESVKLYKNVQIKI